jgi:hypothetical protein
MGQSSQSALNSNATPMKVVDFYLEGFEEWDHSRLCEETAWGVVEHYGWTPTPMLVMWLAKMVEESSHARDWSIPARD